MKTLTAREWNRIISAVNSKETFKEAGLSGEEELQYYQNMWKEAEEIQAKHGIWPIFELAELEW